MRLRCRHGCRRRRQRRVVLRQRCGAAGVGRGSCGGSVRQLEQNPLARARQAGERGAAQRVSTGNGSCNVREAHLARSGDSALNAASCASTRASSAASAAAEASKISSKSIAAGCERVPSPALQRGVAQAPQRRLRRVMWSCGDVGHRSPARNGRGARAADCFCATSFLALHSRPRRAPEPVSARTMPFGIDTGSPVRTRPLMESWTAGELEQERLAASGGYWRAARSVSPSRSHRKSYTSELRAARKCVAAARALRRSPGRSEQALTAGASPAQLAGQRDVRGGAAHAAPAASPPVARRRRGAARRRAGGHPKTPPHSSNEAGARRAARRGASAACLRPRGAAHASQPSRARAAAFPARSPRRSARALTLTGPRLRRACGCPPTPGGSCSGSWTPRRRTRTWWCTSTTRRAPP